MGIKCVLRVVCCELWASGYVLQVNAVNLRLGVISVGAAFQPR
jgi:hypothetical protein